MSSSIDTPPPFMEEEAEPQDTLDLRIAAIFIILLSSAMGGFAPFAIKVFRDASHPVTLILRAFSAGIILALALVHVNVEGNGQLESIEALDGYPVAACCVIFGIWSMMVIEVLTRRWLKGSASKAAAALASCHEQDDTTEHAADKCEGWVSHDTVAEGGAASSSVAAAPCHTHGCISVTHAGNAALVVNEQGFNGKASAYMFEFACVVHSVLIGVALGVTTSGRKDVTSLLIVLVFHQFFEGLALGTTFLKFGFHLKKTGAMISLFSLTTPVGIAIGIAVASSYDPESLNALVTQGVLDSVSGGLLLYVALVQMIAEDFSMNQNNVLWVQLSALFAVLVGATIMAVFGIWA